MDSVCEGESMIWTGKAKGRDLTSVDDRGPGKLFLRTFHGRRGAAVAVVVVDGGGTVDEVAAVVGVATAQYGWIQHRGQAGMAEVELVGGREEKTPHVDGEKIGAVATPHRHRLEETGVGNTHLPKITTVRRKPQTGGDRKRRRVCYGEDGVAEVAVDVAELLGRRRGEVVQGKGG
ncbi:hypothetical protein BHE74_00002178 [Ensete ventricosum]|uniref:Uncharacterized protein n=1 Tax=Ensete ventricosum TaxID=4639 RepID=A0A426Y0X3_ENSVE|nr:hypothetical protein B296_00034882 [Ensete ventricosum]RWV95457.1 hypothetical protein GW17_00041914 [Ensete ventricosum]RWW88928.1 hypothetical protein BHE74_00002178 [Ensete ventricosum]RZR75898.1 hypothetical protein BHM03_00000480 [Ensete ventricosum]